MVDKSRPYLFVYGTLLDESNPFGAYLTKNSAFIAKGRFRGKLFDIGNYPGAIVDDGIDNFVYGSIYELKNPDVVLKELDEYEGFGEDFAQPNEFIRDLVEAETENGLLICWVYYYNHPIAGKKRIYSGRYR